MVKTKVQPGVKSLNFWNKMHKITMIIGIKSKTEIMDLHNCIFIDQTVCKPMARGLGGGGGLPILPPPARGNPGTGDFPSWDFPSWVSPSPRLCHRPSKILS